ncbi:hypothetical protein U1Q18_000295, partial [Sarracenia purpurea var. burkii]
MDIVASEVSVLHRSTFFAASKRSLLVVCRHQIGASTKHFPRNLRYASRTPTNCVGPFIRSYFISPRFKENEDFDGRACSRSVVAKGSGSHGVKDSVTSVNLGFFWFSKSK